MLKIVLVLQNMMSVHRRNMAVNIIVLILLVAMSVPAELVMSCILMENIVKVSLNFVSGCKNHYIVILVTISMTAELVMSCILRANIVRVSHKAFFFLSFFLSFFFLFNFFILFKLTSIDPGNWIELGKTKSLLALELQWIHSIVNKL